MKHHNSKNQKNQKQIKIKKHKKQQKKCTYFFNPNTGLLIEN